MGIIDTVRTLTNVPTLLALKKGMAPRPLDDVDSFGLQVQRNAEAFPDRPAILFEGREVTWSEFNALANRFANTLSAQGLGRGDTASVVMENRIEFLATIVALNKIGAVGALINTNLRGCFLFSRAASRHMMRALFGRVINMSSVSGLVGNPGQTNYSASKAGMIGFTRSMSGELAGRKVTVNAVAPGFIESDMTAALGDAIVSKAKERIPAKRLGKPEDVAAAVLFLASPAAAYITGQVITVDGGMTSVL